MPGMPSMPSSSFTWHHLGVWHFALVPSLLLVAAVLAYALVASRLGDWPVTRLTFFISGAAVVMLATQSVVGVYDMTYFSDHMVQHLLLIMVAAPLFALATPLDLVYRTGGEAVRRVLDSRAAEVLTHPLVAFALYGAFIPLTHLTGLMNLMLEHMWVHHLEQFLFLVVGYLFFRAAFGLERGRTIHPGLRLVYVMAAVPVDTITGLALNMSSHNPFPAYRHLAPAGSTPASILADVHLGGAIMWIGGDALMLLACIPIALAWVRWETLRTAELDRELDAQGL